MFTVNNLNQANYKNLSLNKVSYKGKKDLYTDMWLRFPLFSAAKSSKSADVSFTANEHGDVFVKSTKDIKDPSTNPSQGFISWLFDNNVPDDASHLFLYHW